MELPTALKWWPPERAPRKARGRYTIEIVSSALNCDRSANFSELYIQYDFDLQRSRRVR